MARTLQNDAPVVLIRMAATILVVAAIYLARDFLIPLSLAVLLTFVLGPPVRALERRRLPTVFAVILTCVLAFTFVAVVAYFVSLQVLDLLHELPKYRENIKSRLRLVLVQKPTVFDKLRTMEKEIEEEQAIEDAKDEEPPEDEREATEQGRTERGGQERPINPSSRDPPPRFEGQQHQDSARLDPRIERRSEPQATGPPIPVELRDQPKGLVANLESYFRRFLDPLIGAGVVIIFVIFFLVQRNDLRDRILRLMGHGKLYVSTQALDDAAARISRYLLMTLLINFTYGLPVAIGLWLIGVPGFLMWGLIAMLLRFIPYVGPWVAAGLPIVLSLAVFEGWQEPLLTLGLFIVLELVSNNVMEPWLYGTSAGMSSVAVLVAVVFWGWLWGPIGLMVAVPLTVLLVVAGKYIPPLRPFNIMFGSEPALEPHQRIYNRLLALDVGEALHIAKEYLHQNDLLSLYDDVLLPTLHLAERDRHRGHITLERDEKIGVVMRKVLEKVEEWTARPDAGAAIEGKDEASANSGATPSRRAPVICLSARDEADALAARIVANFLSIRGAELEILSPDLLVGEMAERVRDSGTRYVLISAMPPAAMTRSRYLCKRLGTDPAIHVVVGLWCWSGDRRRAKSRLLEADADDVVFSLAQLFAKLEPFLDLKEPMRPPESEKRPVESP